jgi:hypothetical protein
MQQESWEEEEEDMHKTYVELVDLLKPLQQAAFQQAPLPSKLQERDIAQCAVQAKVLIVKNSRLQILRTQRLKKKRSRPPC